MKLNKLQTTFLVISMSLSTMLPAEIVLDGTLGAKGALVGPHFLIEETMGQQFEGNLFHSFESFTINMGESATFMGSDFVTNIISRVTGNQVSFINGLLRSEMPSANLYFLNPNGFLFGDQATLDIQGGFHVSTADTLYLGEGGRFDASTPNHSVLTIAPPTHFGFLSNQPGEVTIQGSFLQVLPEKNLSITSGDLHIQNGTLYAPDGQINLVSVAAAGDIVPG
jgi:filamentous hemagglutinin family protein